MPVLTVGSTVRTAMALHLSGPPVADLHGGCPAVAAAGAHNLTIRDLVLDTVRLPFSAVTVVAASADGREVGLRLAEPDRSEFNTSKYPWLAAMSFSYGNFNIVFDRFPRICQLDPTLHAPCATFSLTAVLIG